MTHLTFLASVKGSENHYGRDRCHDCNALTTFFVENALHLRVAHYSDCLSLMQFFFYFLPLKNQFKRLQHIQLLD